MPSATRFDGEAMGSPLVRCEPVPGVDCRPSSRAVAVAVVVRGYPGVTPQVFTVAVIRLND
jgi:hypothetical protein